MWSTATVQAKDAKSIVVVSPDLHQEDFPLAVVGQIAGVESDWWSSS